MARLITEIKARPGYQEQIQKLLLKLLEPTRKEQGCCQYELYYDAGSKDFFVIEEIWCSEKSLNMHRTSKHLLQFKQDSKEALDFIRHRPLYFVG